MTHVSLIGRFACAAIAAAVFYGIANLFFNVGLPASEATDLMSSPIYQSISLGFAALGAFIGWKSAELLLQSALYLWLAEIFIGLISAVWN